MSKKYCDCGNPAKWVYMPGFRDSENDFICDDCVPRGCSCNTYYINEGDNSTPPTDDNWKWLINGVTWAYIDKKGREYPCVEFEYDVDENNFSEF